MKHTILHDLDVPTAHRLVDRAFASYEVRYAAYEPVLRWRTDGRADLTLRVKGVPLSGTIVLEDHKLNVAVDVPFVFRPFQKRALEVIDREVRRWLEPSPPAEGSA